MAEKSPRLRFADFKTKRALLEQDFLQEPCLKGARLRIAEENPGARLATKTSSMRHHRTRSPGASMERVRTLVAVMALSEARCFCETHGASLIMIRIFPFYTMGAPFVLGVTAPGALLRSTLTHSPCQVAESHAFANELNPEQHTKQPDCRH